MEKIYATPAAGMRCRKQDGSVLAESGEPVARNAFWLRRERDGDVTLTAVPDAAVADVPDATSNKPKK